MPLQNTQAEGVLTFGSPTVDMNPSNGAWALGVGDGSGQGGYLRLWNDATVRGENRLLPGATGVLPYTKRITEHRCDLRLMVVGDVDGQTSLPVADTRVGLETNMDYLWTNVIDPPSTTTSMRGVALTKPSGAVVTGFVQVLGAVTQQYMLSECGSIWIATLQLNLPYGRLT